MYKLTEYELSLWQHPYPQKCSVQGEDFTITEADIVSGGFTIDRRSVSGDMIEIGSVISAEMGIVLTNMDGRWDSVQLEGESVYVSVSTTKYDQLDPQTNIVPMGYYIIDRAERRLGRVTLTAYDRMMQFDRVVDVSTLTFPTTPETLIRRCCTACDVPLGVEDFSGFTNYDAEIAEVILEGQTYRTVLSYALEMMGVCGWCDYDGDFVCGWYSTPTENYLRITESNRTFSEIGDGITLTGVQIDGTVYLPVGGTDDYLINIEGNPFITDDNRDEIGTALLTNIVGFHYFPATFTVKACPHVWPMDMLTASRGDTEYPIIVSGMTFKLNGNTAIESNGKTATAEGYATANPLTRAEAAIIKQVVASETSHMGEKITEISKINDIASNSLGFHSTIETQPDGSVIAYTHDKENLADSTIIYKKTSAGFFLSQDGGATYTSGWDSDGNAVLNILSVNGLKADWIFAGQLKDRTGGENFFLDLDTGELKIGNGELHYLNGVLSLGDEANVHIELDNDSVDIVDGQTLIASLGASISQFPRVQIDEYLHIGNWEVTQNGGFNVKWIG